MLLGFPLGQALMLCSRRKEEVEVEVVEEIAEEEIINLLHMFRGQLIELLI